MPFGSNLPVEGMSATQARGARIWVTETIGRDLQDIREWDLDRLARELLDAAYRPEGSGNRAASALLGVLWGVAPMAGCRM
jgi:hypothetical protein